jgi:HK97 family phage prohead protease
MPYAVRRNEDVCPASKPWELYRERDAGRPERHIGCHPTEEAANRQMRAIGRATHQSTVKDHNMSSGEWLRLGVDGVIPVTWDMSKAGDHGRLEGYASVFNTVDLQDDVMERGAFTKTLREWQSSKRVIPLTVDHERTVEGTIGSLTEATEDPFGLRFTASFASTPRAQDARTKAREGHLNGISAYGPIYRHSFRKTADGHEVRVLQEVGLYEVTLTPIPANTSALVLKAASGIPAHHTAVVERSSPDMSAAVGRIPNDAGAARLRQMFAGIRPGADPDLKASYILPHHEVSANGEVGPAIISEVRNRLGRLEQTEGIDQATHDGARTHLMTHLNDFRQKQSSLNLPEAWTADLQAALALSSPAAQKAAVDLLIREQYTLAGHSEDPGDGDSESPPPVEKNDDDAARYALSIIDESAPPPDGAPGGTPSRSSPADSIVNAVAVEKAAADLDLLEKQVRRELGHE